MDKWKIILGILFVALAIYFYNISIHQDEVGVVEEDIVKIDKKELKGDLELGGESDVDVSVNIEDQKMVPPGVNDIHNLTNEMSPSGKYILVTIGLGDGVDPWIFEVEKEVWHELPKIFTAVEDWGWLSDDKIYIYSGCIVTECVRYESKSSERPWEVGQVNK